MKNLLVFIALFLISGNIFSQDKGVIISESEDYKYDSPRTNYLGVNYTAFQSSVPDAYSFVFSTFSAPYKFFDGGTGIFGYANAPIFLPDGVIITNMTAYVYDNSATEFLRLRLIESVYGGVNTLKASIETTAASNSAIVQEISSGAINIPIDNSLNSYFLRFESSDNSISDIRLYGVKIEYTTLRAQ